MNAYLLSLNPEANIADQWDFGFLQDFLRGKVWKTQDWKDFNIINTDKLYKDKKAIVVIPARHHKGMEDKINQELQKIEHIVLFLMGDEEADFEVEKINHKSIHIWVQNPHMGRHDQYNKLGTGYPPHITPVEAEKDLNVYFSGQVTHRRRLELTDVLIDMNDNKVLVTRTKGFTQGEKPEDYYKYMSRAKIAPCPSGAIIPDSFRFFEALECMAIPIADQKLPTGETWQYWDWLFGSETPFPKITEWDRLFGLVPELLKDYPHNMHKVTAWWINYKRNFTYKVLEQLNG